eukprot:666213-Amphidinium_carterae.1
MVLRSFIIVHSLPWFASHARLHSKNSNSTASSESLQSRMKERDTIAASLQLARREVCPQYR